LKVSEDNLRFNAYAFVFAPFSFVNIPLIDKTVYPFGEHVSLAKTLCGKINNTEKARIKNILFFILKFFN
jgi:hypothetical protein